MDIEQFTRKKSVNLNSVWRKLERTGFKFYCVSCHRERLLSVPARAGSVPFYAHVLITTAFLMLVSWPLFHFKGAVLFIPVYVLFDIFYRIRMRAILVCPDCDFDPVLYLVDRDQAVQQVENVWRKKFEERGYPFPERKRNGALRRKPQTQDLSDAGGAISPNSAENNEDDTTFNQKVAPTFKGPESNP